MTEKKAKTAAYRLFHFKYEMRIPQIFLYGKDYLEKNGYHVSGDAGLDQLRLMEPSVMRQTAAGLAMLHDEGAPIDFVNHRDTVLVYDDIQEHLLDWERVAIQGIHPDDAPPLEEFRQLEAIAVALYETSKFYEPNESSGDNLRDRLMAMNRSRNPVRTERYLRNRITTDKGELKPYTSVVDRLENALMENNPWR